MSLTKRCSTCDVWSQCVLTLFIHVWQVRLSHRHKDKETDRGTIGQTHTGRETDIDNQTERQTHRQRHRQTERQSETHKRQSDRETVRHRQADSQRERRRDYQTDRETVRHRKTVRQSDRQRDRHRQTASQDESPPERPAELAADGVRHRGGEHGAELQRSQLPVREALHGHAGVWWVELTEPEGHCILHGRLISDFNIGSFIVQALNTFCKYIKLKWSRFGLFCFSVTVITDMGHPDDLIMICFCVCLNSNLPDITFFVHFPSEWSPSSDIRHLDIAVIDHSLCLCHWYSEQDVRQLLTFSTFFLLVVDMWCIITECCVVACRLYHVTLWTFVLALGHFLSEAFIYKTAPLTIGVMAPLIVASEYDSLQVQEHFLIPNDLPPGYRPQKTNRRVIFIMFANDKAQCTGINIHKERQLCNFVYSMHNIHINIHSYLQHLFNARYLASQFNNMFCRGAATATQWFCIGFALSIHILIICYYRENDEIRSKFELLGDVPIYCKNHEYWTYIELMSLLSCRLRYSKHPMLPTTYCSKLSLKWPSIKITRHKTTYTSPSV